MLPALEDVPDGEGDLLPVVIGLLDDIEKCGSVLGSFPPSSGESPGRRGKRAEVGFFEPSIERAREWRIRNQNEIVVPAFPV